MLEYPAFPTWMMEIPTTTGMKWHWSSYQDNIKDGWCAALPEFIDSNIALELWSLPYASLNCCLHVVTGLDEGFIRDSRWQESMHIKMHPLCCKIAVAE
jgi:hypothetical protein